MVVVQTVAGTDAFKPGVPRTKRIWLVRYYTVPFITSVYLEAPVSEGGETVAAIERPADTTVSDEVDVSTERTVAALPEFTNEACKALDKYNI